MCSFLHYGKHNVNEYDHINLKSAWQDRPAMIRVGHAVIDVCEARWEEIVKYEAQVLQVEDVVPEDVIVLEALRVREKTLQVKVRMSESVVKYCEYGINNNVEAELNLEVEAELVGKVEHEVEVVAQVHV